MKNVLAIGGHWHEGSIAVLYNNSFDYCALERLNRVKCSGFESISSIEHLLDTIHVPLNEIDTVIWVGSDTYRYTSVYGSEMKQWFDTLDKETVIVDHHDAHCASSYYTSEFSDAIVLSLDDTGDGLSGKLAIGNGTQLTQVDAMPSVFSLGRLWEAINIILGYRGPNDSGKTMALSAWGKQPKYLEFFRSLVSEKDFFFQYAHSEDLPPAVTKMFGHTLNGNVILATYIATHLELMILGSHLHSKLGTSDQRYHDTLQDYYDLVLSLQIFTNEVANSIVSKAMQTTETSNLCLAGGVSLNGIMNNSLANDLPLTGIHVPPMVSDCGLSIGGLLWHLNMDKTEPYRLSTPFIPYSGPVSTDTQIQDVLAEFSTEIEWCRSDNLHDDVADLLAEGSIVGWYQGSSEIGPRALGNRSILAHPGTGTMKDRLNAIIKKREAFRPFAPAVLEEEAERYFELPSILTHSPYMLFIADVRSEYADTIKDVLHTDMTARVQTVSNQMNPSFYALIQAFFKKTGIPIVLNTSFNDNDEPIVFSPTDAMVCFLENDLDHLALGSYIITRTSSSAPKTL